MSALRILLAEVPPGDVGQRLRARRVNGSPSFSCEQLAHVGGRQVQGGRDDVRRAAGRPAARGTRPGRSRRRGCPSAASMWFSSISSLTIDFDLTTRLDVVLAGDVEHVRLASSASSAQSTVDAAGRDVPLELDQQLVEVGDGVGLDRGGPPRATPASRESRRRSRGCACSSARRDSPSDFEPGRLVQPLASRSLRNSAPWRSMSLAWDRDDGSDMDRIRRSLRFRLLVATSTSAMCFVRMCRVAGSRLQDAADVHQATDVGRDDHVGAAA